MTPAETVARWYGLEDFNRVVSSHLLNGYVLSTPEVFVMGRAVPAGAEDSAIADFDHVFPVEQCDAWFVTVIAGSLAAGLRLLPYPLPWLIFQRDNGPLKRYKAESLTRRICHG